MMNVTPRGRGGMARVMSVIVPVLAAAVAGVLIWPTSPAVALLGAVSAGIVAYVLVVPLIRQRVPADAAGVPPVPLPVTPSAATSEADELTGLPVRKQAEAHLHTEFAAAGRGRPIAVLMFALDALESYNNVNGRAAGDGVQRGLANLLRQHTRRGDISARYAPDSFITILGGCGEEGAMVFATRVQEWLRSAQDIVALPNVSVGVACYRTDMTTSSAVVDAALEALDEAQRAGGDRIRIYGRSVEHVAAQLAGVSAARPQEPDADGEGLSVPGRTAIVLARDAAIHAELAQLLRAEGFVVSDRATTAEEHAEHDIAFVDFADGIEHTAVITQQIRQRTPATRVIGITRAAGGVITADVLRVRVDGYHVAGSDGAQLRRDLQELVAERDARVFTQLRERQLSAEMHAVSRESRNAIAASEARFRAVVQTIQEVIFATDLDGRWLSLNPAWTLITGFTVDESLGTPLFEFLHPDDVGEVRASFGQLVRSGAPYYRHDGRWRTRSGGYRWVELRLQTSASAGVVDGTSGVLVDVTDRRRAEEGLRLSEEYFRSLIENSADVMTAVNADGTVRYISPAVKSLLGYSVEEWIGKDAFSYVHPDDLEPAREEFQRLIIDQESANDIELRMRHRDGHWLLVELSGRNLLHTPALGAIIVNARDATDRRRAEAALRESESALMQAHKMAAIARLAGGMASEFDPLLTEIRAHTDALEASVRDDAVDTDEVDADAARDALERIRAAVQRGSAITEQLQAVGGNRPREPEDVALSDVIEGATARLRELAGARIGLSLQLARELRVHADAAQLEQVLLSIVANARDAMPEGGLIEITTAPRTVRAADTLPREVQPGDYAVISISDTGAGMNEEALAHSFEPFFTSKRASSRRGLGLAAAYGMIHQNGGYVRIESEPGHGTLVQIFLPVVAVPQSPHAGLPPGLTHATGGR